MASRSMRRRWLSDFSGTLDRRKFDNPRAVQIRLATFDHGKLCEVGRTVRDIYTEHCNAADRVRAEQMINTSSRWRQR